MARRTIDYGIDLGTTNSSIALFENGNCTVFQNDYDDELTPSAVQIDEAGQLVIGKKAYQHLIEDEENTVSQFKLWMGTHQTKDFKRSKKVMSPEELSAEVLKDLKINVRRSQNEDVKYAVITVPASFGALKCDATQRAAHLAGIEGAPLLQEPIAASIAYGMFKSNQNGRWLVYDLGGGTFDVALVSIEGGLLSVIDHEGDNHLGGSNWDKILVDAFVITFLKENFSINTFMSSHGI